MLGSIATAIILQLISTSSENVFCNKGQNLEEGSPLSCNPSNITDCDIPNIPETYENFELLHEFKLHNQ